jgi:hypothetical protein
MVGNAGTIQLPAVANLQVVSMQTGVEGVQCNARNDVAAVWFAACQTDNRLQEVVVLL